MGREQSERETLESDDQTLRTGRSTTVSITSSTSNGRHSTSSSTRTPTPTSSVSPASRLLSLPDTILRHVILYSPQLSELSLVCKKLEEACRPILWRRMVFPGRNEREHEIWRDETKAFIDILLREMRTKREMGSDVEPSARLSYVRHLHINIGLASSEEEAVYGHLPTSFSYFTCWRHDDSGACLACTPASTTDDDNGRVRMRYFDILAEVAPNLQSLTIRLGFLGGPIDIAGLLLCQIEVELAKGHLTIPRLTILNTDCTIFANVLPRYARSLTSLSLSNVGDYEDGDCEAPLADRENPGFCQRFHISTCYGCARTITHVSPLSQRFFARIDKLDRLTLVTERSNDHMYKFVTDMLVLQSDLRYLSIEDSSIVCRPGFLSLGQLETLDMTRMPPRQLAWLNFERLGKLPALKSVAYSDDGLEMGYYGFLAAYQFRSATLQRITISVSLYKCGFLRRNGLPGLPIDDLPFDINESQPVSYLMENVIEANPSLTSVTYHPSCMDADTQLARATPSLHTEWQIPGSIIRTHTRFDESFIHIRSVTSSTFTEKSDCEDIPSEYLHEACDGYYVDVGDELFWQNSTAYNGKHVPWNVVQQIYEMLGETEEWNEGGRDLELPQEAWDRLRRYDEEGR